MKCPVCNKRNKSGQGICAYCGAKLPIENLEGKSSRNVVDRHKLSITKGLLIGIIAGSVIILTILIYMFLNPKDENTGKILNQDKKVEIEQQNNKQKPENNVQKNKETKSTEKIESVPGKVVTGIVKDYRLRLRSRPSLRSAIVDHLPKGAEVIITEKTKKVKIRVGNKYLTGNWYKIKWEKENQDGEYTTVKGWVWGSYLFIKR